MKTLLILRHAKSSWGDASLEDHDRPLNDRGRSAASRMGRFLFDEGLIPDRILCSTARRTRETLERLGRNWEQEPEVRFEERLYLASAEQLLDILGHQEPKSGVLLLIGHNPGLAELAIGLAGKGETWLLERLQRKLPTGALVEIGFDVESWAEVRLGGGYLRRFVAPKELPD